MGLIPIKPLSFPAIQRFLPQKRVVWQHKDAGTSVEFRHNMVGMDVWEWIYAGSQPPFPKMMVPFGRR